jgi:hypothetical protein
VVDRCRCRLVNRSRGRLVNGRYRLRGNWFVSRDYSREGSRLVNRYRSRLVNRCGSRLVNRCGSGHIRFSGNRCVRSDTFIFDISNVTAIRSTD